MKAGQLLEQVYGARTAGFPDDKAGTLKTYKAHPEYYSFQFYYPYENNNVYKRILDRTTLEWGEFVKQNAYFTITSNKNSLNNTPALDFEFRHNKRNCTNYKRNRVSRKYRWYFRNQQTSSDKLQLSIILCIQQQSCV